MPQPNPDALEAVRRASDGLLYPSETDAPFEPFRWTDTSRGSAADQVKQRARKGQRVEEQPIADFFSALDGSEDADRFRELRRALEASLPDLHVFRVGEVRVAVYLIGKTSSGDWAGLRTTSVET